MYAPLALKFVYSNRPLSMSDLLFLRAPVLQISVNPATTGTSSKSKSHTGAIAGGTIAAVIAFLAIGAMALVARRRRSRIFRRGSVGSSFATVVTAPNWPRPMSVTPFNATLIEVAAPQTVSQTNSRRRWTEPVEHESISLAHDSSSTPSDSPVSGPRVVSVPVGLSSKELARLRNDSSRSRPSDQLPAGPTLAATTESGITTSSSEAQRLRTEVEYLREQLRAERSEPPPCYEDGSA
jgi:hypothetical protein